MTEKFEPVSGDEYWYRQGESKCVCGHWGFQHETTILSAFFGDKFGGYCHDCKCPHFKHETKVTDGLSKENES